MNRKEAEEHVDRLQKFLTVRVGKMVAVSGMWTGDFIGQVRVVAFTMVSFRVDKPQSDSIKPGDIISFPYGTFLKVRDLTDEERQPAISEAVGDIEVQ